MVSICGGSVVWIPHDAIHFSVFSFFSYIHSFFFSIILFCIGMLVVVFADGMLMTWLNDLRWMMVGR